MKKFYLSKYLCFLMVFVQASMLGVQAETANFEDMGSPLSNSGVNSRADFTPEEGTSSAPVAAFSLSDTMVNVGDTIWCTDNSNNGPARFWTFEGGTPESSSEQNPGVWYSVPGTYKISLTVWNSGEADTLYKTILVEATDASAAPVAAFSRSERFISVGDSVAFTDESENSPTEWAWYFEGGSPQYSNEQNPTVNYYSDGDFIVRLVVSNSAGSDTATKFETVVDSSTFMHPIASFYMSSSTVKAGDTVTFYDQSLYDQGRLWGFEGGSPESSNEQTPKVWYSQPGTYTVSLMVWNGVSSDTLVKTILVEATDASAAPVAAFSRSERYVSVGSPVSFTDESENSPTEWAWYFEGGSPQYSNEQNPTVNYYSEGKFTVRLVVSNSAGSDTATMFEAVVDSSTFMHPIASFDMSHSTVKVNDTVTFYDQSQYGQGRLWGFEGGTPESSNEQNPKVWYSQPGTYTVSLMVWNGVSSDTLVKTILVEATDSEIGGKTGLEEQEKIKFLVYPNIVSEKLQISTDDINAEFKIVNLVGATVKSETVNGNYHVLNVSDLPTGVYYLYLDNKGKVSVSKFIKQ